MKALSIRQPFAWAIVSGYKDIENRSWHTNYRGRIYIHAGRSKEDLTKYSAAAIIRNLPNNRAAGDFMMALSNMTLGAIVGEATIVDCVEASKSPWFVGEHGFVLEDVIAYDEPIPLRGQPSLFEVEF